MVSIQRGYDVTEYALVSFGGAGGQHACMIADVLGMETIHMHPLSGVLSAYGMGLADISATRLRAIEKSLEAATLKDVSSQVDALISQNTSELAEQDVTEDDMGTQVRVHLRYKGTDTALPVIMGALEAMRTAFEAEHKQRFGFTDPERPIIIEAIEVETSGGGADAREYEMIVRKKFQSRKRPFPPPTRPHVSFQTASGMRQPSICGLNWSLDMRYWGQRS